MSTEELEQACIRRWPDFECGVLPRGDGFTAVATMTVRGCRVYVQRGCPSEDEARLWRRLILEQCAGERGPFG